MKENKIERLKVPEILGIPRGVIFSDLDGVWFDEAENFALSNPKTLNTVRRAIEAGYLMVLNSDSGTEALANWSRELGFNGPVVAESGAIVYFPSIDWKEYLSPYKDFFIRFKEKILVALLERFPESAIFLGDATEFIRKNNKIPGINQMAYLINTARECSFGIYTRKIGENSLLFVEDKKTQQTETLLRNLLAEEPEGEKLACKRYPVLGSCLVKDPTMRKAKAVEWFIRQFPPSLPCYMIGDSINDSMEELGRRVTTCAVGNASPELKQAVERNNGILAPKSLKIATGAAYIINQILTRKE